jgi:hypothetical protein
MRLIIEHLKENFKNNFDNIALIFIIEFLLFYIGGYLSRFLLEIPSQIFRESSGIFYISIIMLIEGILTIIFITCYSLYYNNLKEQILVYKILGANQLQIFFLYLFENLLFMLFSFLFASMIDYLTYYLVSLANPLDYNKDNFVYKSMNWIIFLLDFSLSIIPPLLSFVIYLPYIFKKSRGGK